MFRFGVIYQKAHFICCFECNTEYFQLQCSVTFAFLKLRGVALIAENLTSHWNQEPIFKSGLVKTLNTLLVTSNISLKLSCEKHGLGQSYKKIETNLRLNDCLLFLGASNGLVSAWDTTTNTCFLHWKADSAEITFMKTRGDRLLVAGASRNIRLWSLVGTKEARCYSNTINFVMEDELSLNAPVSTAFLENFLRKCSYQVG